MSLNCSVGALLGLILNGLLSSTHKGTLECVVPINITECAQSVCAQRGVVSWCILSWGVLGGSVCCSIVGRVWLLTVSLWLVIALVARPVISSLPLLIVGGRLVGTVLLCEHLSQRSGWSRGRGLNLLHWWWIVYLWGWWCHKSRNFPHILLCWPSHGLSLLWWHRLCTRGCCSGLGHHSSIVWSLVLVRNISSVAWLWCDGRWCRSRLWLLGDWPYDVIRSVGCP